MGIRQRKEESMQVGDSTAWAGVSVSSVWLESEKYEVGEAWDEAEEGRC